MAQNVDSAIQNTGVYSSQQAQDYYNAQLGQGSIAPPGLYVPKVKTMIKLEASDTFSLVLGSLEVMMLTFKPWKPARA
jgi:hypothetical protein